MGNVVLAHMTHRSYNTNRYVDIYDGNKVEQKHFETKAEAINYLISNGFTIKSEAFDEEYYSVWFEKRV